MPDAARKWLEDNDKLEELIEEHQGETIFVGPEQHDIAIAHLRRLLAENERLEAQVESHDDAWVGLTAQWQKLVRKQRYEIQGLEADRDALVALIEYAGGILSHGTPGDAWMDWVLRVQGQLGIDFHNARYEDENKIPFKRLEERVEHLPRVYLRELKAVQRLDSDD